MAWLIHILTNQYLFTLDVSAPKLQIFIYSDGKKFQAFLFNSRVGLRFSYRDGCCSGSGGVPGEAVWHGFRQSLLLYHTVARWDLGVKEVAFDSRTAAKQSRCFPIVSLTHLPYRVFYFTGMPINLCVFRMQSWTYSHVTLSEIIGLWVNQKW